MDPFRNTARESHLLRVANKGFGVITLDELLAAGVTNTMVRNRVRQRRLNRLHRGVYALGHTVLRAEGRWLAALRAIGEDATLSHTSASAYFGWTVEDPDVPVHVATLTSCRSRPGIVVHRVRHLDRVDVNRPHPLRVTAMPRTLVDLADVLDWTDYRAVADAQHRLDIPRIREAQARAGRRVGSPKVARLIDADDAHTKSEFERRFLRFAAGHGLPRPDALNAPVAGHTADCVYRRQRLVVELDGRAFHRRRAQMRADRRRDTDYQLAGFRILRLLWDDLHRDEAVATAARVAAMLAAGGAG